MKRKEKCRITIEYNKIYVWIHDTYTKLLRWKTYKNSPPMYTSIMKLPLMCGPHKSYDLSTSPMTYTRFMKDLYVITYYFIKIILILIILWLI